MPQNVVRAPPPKIRAITPTLITPLNGHNNA
jgi:hypothetical protein